MYLFGFFVHGISTYACVCMRACVCALRGLKTSGMIWCDIDLV